MSLPNRDYLYDESKSDDDDAKINVEDRHGLVAGDGSAAPQEVPPHADPAQALTAAQKRSRTALSVLKFIGLLLSYVSLLMALVAIGRNGSCCLPSSCSVNALSGSHAQYRDELWSYATADSAKGICMFRSEMATLAGELGSACDANLKEAQDPRCKFQGPPKGEEKVGKVDGSITCKTPQLNAGALKAVTVFVFLLLVFQQARVFVLWFLPEKYKKREWADMASKVTMTLTGMMLVGLIIAIPFSLVNLMSLKSLSERKMLQNADPNTPAHFASPGCGAASFRDVQRLAWVDKRPLIGANIVYLFVCVIWAVVWLRENWFTREPEHTDYQWVAPDEDRLDGAGGGNIAAPPAAPHQLPRPVVAGTVVAATTDPGSPGPVLASPAEAPQQEQEQQQHTSSHPDRLAEILGVTE